jgi:hypothetical protein
MSDPTLEPRVTLLESLMGEFVAGSIRTQQSVEQLSLEMREFKGEMRDFKQEMKDFKDEMKDFKDEMLDFKQEMREETRRFNKQLGEIANKQGRIAEDLVAPSIGRIVREITHSPCEETEYEAVRVRTHHRISGERREFDVLAICGEYVLIVETKITLTPEKVDGFVELMEDIRNYFPNYESRKMIGGLATLYADTSIVTYASRNGILVLAVGDDLLDIQNGPVFRPREF